MNKVSILNSDGAAEKEYLVPDSRLGVLIDYLKGVKQEEFNGTWGPAERTLFAGFSDQIPKNGT